MEVDRFEPFFGIAKQLNLQFVLGYTAEEFAESLHHIAEDKIDRAPLITGHVGLDGVKGAFAEPANPERHAKIMVDPWRLSERIAFSPGAGHPQLRRHRQAASVRVEAAALLAGVAPINGKVVAAIAVAGIAITSSAASQSGNSDRCPMLLASNRSCPREPARCRPSICRPRPVLGPMRARWSWRTTRAPAIIRPPTAARSISPVA
jgi:hypothetical protein